MTKEDYINSIKALEKLRDKIKEEYTSSYNKFKIGDKVRRVIRKDPNEIGIVVGYGIGFRYNIIPIVFKIKKDGNISKINMDILNDKEIEKI